MNIYEITKEYAEKLRKIDEYAAEHDGEVPEEMIAELLGIDGDFTVKAENIVRVMKNYYAEAEAIKAEATRLTAKAEYPKNAGDRLKKLLLDAMTALGKDKEKTPLFALSVRTSKVADGDVNLLPEEYVRVKREPDKTAIKAALEAGVEVPGATLGESKSLIIR